MKLMLVSYFSMLSIVIRSQPGGRVVLMRSAAITVASWRDVSAGMTREESG